MKTLPANLILEKNKLHTPSAWLILSEIILTDGTTLRLARNTEDVAFREDDYTKAGCVAHWKLDDDLATNAVVDSSPSAVATTLQGGNNTEDISEAGKAGTALHLDGSLDYITTAHKAEHEPGTGDFSISLWFKADANAGVQRLVWKHNTVTSYGYYVYVNAGTLYAIFEDGVVVETVSHSGLIAGTWYHVVAVRDATGGNIYLYVDGVLVDTEADSSGDITFNSGVAIGGNIAGGELFDGVIDNVALWNRALSLTEAKYLHNGGAGTQTNPQLYTAFPVQIEPSSQSAKGDIPTLKLSVSNVTRLVQPYLESLDGGIGSTVLVTIINSNYKAEDYAELQLSYDIIETASDSKWVVFTLGAPNPLRRRFPADRYFASSCRFLFRDSDDVVSLGCAYAGKSVADITLGSGVPVSVEATGHGFATGDVIFLEDVGGTTEVNGNNYTITKTDADNFTLDGTDGDNFTAYTTGGTCGYYTCDRDLAACADHENTARYGGFWGLTPGGVKIA